MRFSRLFVHIHCGATVILFIYSLPLSSFVFLTVLVITFVSIVYLWLVISVSFIVFVYNL